MGTKAGVGFSRLRNPEAAGEQAVAQAMTRAQMNKPDFIFLFATVAYDQQRLLDAIRRASQGAAVCGCSAEGTIAGGIIDETNFSVAVMAICSDEFFFINGLARGLSGEFPAAGRVMAASIKPLLDDQTRGLFVLPDSLKLNYDRIMPHFERHIDWNRFLPVWGGAAGDNWSFNATYQYYNDQVVSDGLAWALLKGNAQVAWAVNHGCVCTGVKHEVTRSIGNTIYEIDGRPAQEIFRRYQPDDKQMDWHKIVVNLSIGMKTPAALNAYDDFIVRFFIGKDDETGSVTITSNMPEGTRIWLMRRDFKKVAHGVDQLSERINRQLAGAPPKLVLHFDCAGRGKVFLREQQKAELLRRMQAGMPPAPWLGFYTYGEIGPVSGQNCFHNYSAVVVAVY